MTIVQVSLYFAALATLVPVSVLFVQVVAALRKHQPREIAGIRRPSVAVLVPAHNEALLISDTLRSIASQLAPGDQLFVVADNCTDDTAGVAALAGAEVIERHDQERRGKGYALDFGIRHLERRPPEVVIIIDADCHVGEGTIDRLARVCGETGRPVQALDLMLSPANGNVGTRIAEFSWLIKNQIRPMGSLRLGLPCQLMGTGMAFAWPTISTAPVATGHIVEDLLLGIELARSGRPPLFCPDALVTSYFPETADGIAGQRTRWEYGHLRVIVSEAPRLFVQSITRGSVNLLALALDLCVPPLALLMILTFAVLVASALLFAALPTATLPVWLAGAAVTMLGSAVFLSWLRYGRAVISLGSLLYAPLYALAKVPLYLRFLAQRQVEWVRSRRGRN